jgi:hypothetical protein
MPDRCPTLDVVIVNWNGGRRLLDSLESLAAAGREGFALGRVVVVDNASTDCSLSLVSGLDLPLVLLRNSRNLGFGAACNQGARGTEADYLLFLNPDTRLSSDSLSKPLLFMEGAAGAARTGVCGVQLVNERGEISRGCARFPKPSHFYAKIFGLDHLAPHPSRNLLMTDWDHRGSRGVDHVIGAFYLVRRSLFEALRGFDERFFVYLEDLDFSYRAHREGWRSYYLAEARVYHEGGGLSSRAMAARLFYSLRSRILYGYKHFGSLPATGLLLATLLVEPWTRISHALAHGRFSSIRETLEAYGMLLRSLPSVIATARDGERS